MRIIERMVKEAEKFADEDRAVKERIEAKNGLENYAYTLRSQVNDASGLGGKLSEEDKAAILKAVDESVSWMDSHSSATKEEIESQKEALEKVVHPITTKLYGGGSGQPAGSNASEQEHDDL